MMRKVMKIFEALKKEGLSVKLIDGKIRISPKDKITADLREQIKRHREEIKKELFLKNHTYNELCQELAKELKDYSGRGMLVRLNFLDENIALTTPKHFEKLKKEGYIAYLPEEVISLLVVKSPQALKTIHEIKKMFDGKIKSAHEEDMKRK
jgi:hypothetical protein